MISVMARALRIAVCVGGLFLVSGCDSSVNVYQNGIFAVQQEIPDRYKFDGIRTKRTGSNVVVEVVFIREDCFK